MVLTYTSLHLRAEYRYLEKVRVQLQQARGDAPQERDERERQRKALIIIILYVLSGTFFLAGCIVIPRIFHRSPSTPSSVIMRMTNHEQFIIIFNKKIPDECAIDPALEGAAVNMIYDRNSIAWSATVPGSKPQIWGRGVSSNRTAASYPPEKHLIIIDGAGFWFDDDGQYQVYRSCGRDERQVGRIIFTD